MQRKRGVAGNEWQEKGCEPGMGVRGKGAAFEPPVPAHLCQTENCLVVHKQASARAGSPVKGNDSAVTQRIVNPRRRAWASERVAVRGRGC